MTKKLRNYFICVHDCHFHAFIHLRVILRCDNGKVVECFEMKMYVQEKRKWRLNGCGKYGQLALSVM